MTSWSLKAVSRILANAARTEGGSPAARVRGLVHDGRRIDHTPGLPPRRPRAASRLGVRHREPKPCGRVFAVGDCSGRVAPGAGPVDCALPAAPRLRHPRRGEPCTLAEANLALFEYIDGFYNGRRIQARLGSLSPIEFEERHHTDQASPNKRT
ncbi:IS3 family transposase [Streptomyces sp. NPDC058252]|uniref:IS3 family transposase n=1 Tax=Streptomyces sp. NPDC058252 TaxID=3346405 RepID=UPI0036E4DFA8